MLGMDPVCLWDSVSVSVTTSTITGGDAGRFCGRLLRVVLAHKCALRSVRRVIFTNTRCRLSLFRG